MHSSPDIYLTAEKKTSAKRPSDEGCSTIHRLKWGPLPPNEVDMIAQQVEEGEGRKE